MQELLNKIKVNKATFTASQKLVANYILENYYQIPFLSITALAENIGVSEYTVIKFCNQLGFNKFGEFKRIFSNHVHSKLLTTDQLMQAVEGHKEKNDVFDEAMTEGLENIHATLINPHNRANLPKFLSMIFKAKNIYVTGSRSSKFLAEYYAYMLRYAGIKVITLTNGDGVYFDHVSMVEKGDLVIAFSFFRYTKEVISALEDLHHSGIEIILITDNAKAPGCPYADLTFYCDVAGNIYFPSYASCLSLCTAMCRAASIKNKKEASKYLQGLEKKLLERHIFV